MQNKRNGDYDKNHNGKIRQKLMNRFDRGKGRYFRGKMMNLTYRVLNFGD